MTLAKRPMIGKDCNLRWRTMKDAKVERIWFPFSLPPPFCFLFKFSSHFSFSISSYHHPCSPPTILPLSNLLLNFDLLFLLSIASCLCQRYQSNDETKKVNITGLQYEGRKRCRVYRMVDESISRTTWLYVTHNNNNVWLVDSKGR